MTSTFDDGAPDWAPDVDTTTALDDDDVVMVQEDAESADSLASVDERAEGGPPADGPWSGGTDAGTGGPVDYWDAEPAPAGPSVAPDPPSGQPLGDAAPQVHFGESVTARDDSLGHDVEVDFSSPQRSWGTDSEGRDVWRDANGSLTVYE